MTEEQIRELQAERDALQAERDELKAALETAKTPPQDTAKPPDGEDDTAELQAQIDALTAALDECKSAHAAEINETRKNGAVNLALTQAKAKNPATVRPLLEKFLETAEMDGESIAGLEEELERIVKENAYLFASAPSFRGITPQDGLTAAEAAKTETETDKLNAAFRRGGKF